MNAEASEDAIFEIARAEFRKIDGCPSFKDVDELNPNATTEFSGYSLPRKFYDLLKVSRASHQYWTLAEYNNSETFEWQRMRVSALLIHEPEQIPNAVLHTATNGDAHAFLCLCATYCRALLIYCPLLWSSHYRAPHFKTLHTARIGPYLRALQAILRQGAASCDACFKETDVSMCGGCKAVVYCGRSCQKLGWSHHKGDCKTLACTMAELGMEGGLFSSTKAASGSK